MTLCFVILLFFWHLYKAAHVQNPYLTYSRNCVRLDTLDSVFHLWLGRSKLLKLHVARDHFDSLSSTSIPVFIWMIRSSKKKFTQKRWRCIFYFALFLFIWLGFKVPFYVFCFVLCPTHCGTVGIQTIHTTKNARHNGEGFRLKRSLFIFHTLSFWNGYFGNINSFMGMLCIWMMNEYVRILREKWEMEKAPLSSINLVHISNKKRTTAKMRKSKKERKSAFHMRSIFHICYFQCSSHLSSVYREISIFFVPFKSKRRRKRYA